MIVLSLGSDQSAVIGNGIVIRVIEIQGDEVLLAIDYPDGTTVRCGGPAATIQQEDEELLALSTG